MHLATGIRHGSGIQSKATRAQQRKGHEHGALAVEFPQQQTARANHQGLYRHHGTLAESVGQTAVGQLKRHATQNQPGHVQADFISQRQLFQLNRHQRIEGAQQHASHQTTRQAQRPVCTRGLAAVGINAAFGIQVRALGPKQGGYRQYTQTGCQPEPRHAGGRNPVDEQLAGTVAEVIDKHVTRHGAGTTMQGRHTQYPAFYRYEAHRRGNARQHTQHQPNR